VFQKSLYRKGSCNAAVLAVLIRIKTGLKPLKGISVCISSVFLHVISIYIYIYIYMFQNVFLHCPTPRLHCFLSSHWPSFRFLSFIAVLIPSIQFLFGLPCGLFCFGIHFNPLKPELNPICYLLALLGAHHFLHVSRIRVKLLTFRRLMSHIYGAPILDVSRSHTTTQHSR